MIVELFGVGGDKPLEDVGTWTQQARKSALAARIAELRRSSNPWRRVQVELLLLASTRG